MTERTMAVALAQLFCGCALAATSAPNMAVRGPAMAGAAGVPGDTDASALSLIEGFDELIGRVRLVSPYMRGQQLQLEQDLMEERGQAIASFREMAEQNAAAKFELVDLSESLHRSLKGNAALQGKAKRLRAEVERLRRSLQSMHANLTMASEYGAHFPKVALRLGADLRVLTDMSKAEEADKAKHDHARRLKEILDGPAIDVAEDNMALLDVGPNDRDVKRFKDALSGVSRLRNKVHGVLRDAATVKQALRKRMDEALRVRKKEEASLRARKVALEERVAQAQEDHDALNDAVAFLQRERKELLDAKTTAAAYVAQVGRQALFAKS